MSRARTSRKPPARNQLRIIAGQWRGRKLPFPDVEGLRPTGDRVRETLFNWLAPVIEGAKVLDLFAGSGALGLEALSRGAERCVFVERDRSAAQVIRDNLALLQCGDADVIQAEALQWLQQFSGSKLDIVFLDPPFRQNLLSPICAALAEHSVLSENSWVYLEMGRDETPPALPEGFSLHREKTAGQTRYQLYRFSASSQ